MVKGGVVLGLWLVAGGEGGRRVQRWGCMQVVQVLGDHHVLLWWWQGFRGQWCWFQPDLI